LQHIETYQVLQPLFCLRKTGFFLFLELFDELFMLGIGFPQMLKELQSKQLAIDATNSSLEAYSMPIELTLSSEPLFEAIPSSSSHSLSPFRGGWVSVGSENRLPRAA
jgi:hypothetical protein